MFSELPQVESRGAVLPHLANSERADHTLTQYLRNGNVGSARYRKRQHPEDQLPMTRTRKPM